MSTITKECTELKSFITGFLTDPAHDNQSSRSMTAEVFRIALASLEAEPVITVGDNGGDALAYRRLIQAFPTGTKLFTSPPAPVVPDEIYAELYRLREEVKGPDGFDTWRDAAVAEKKARVEQERATAQYVSHIDYLSAMTAFHSEEWHKMGPITGYMHGWNACRAAMLQGAENVELRCTIQTAPALDSSPKNAESRCCKSPVIPDGLISAVNRLLDSDGSRGCYSARRCHDAHEEIERLLAATPKQEVKS